MNAGVSAPKSSMEGVRLRNRAHALFFSVRTGEKGRRKAPALPGAPFRPQPFRPHGNRRIGSRTDAPGRVGAESRKTLYKTRGHGITAEHPAYAVRGALRAFARAAVRPPGPGRVPAETPENRQKKSDEEHTTSDQDSLSASDGGTIPRRRGFVKHCLKKRYRKRRKSPLSPCPETLRATLSGRSADVPRSAGRFRLSEKHRKGFPPAYFPLQNRNEPATAGGTCPAKRTKPKRTENASNRP